MKQYLVTCGIIPQSGECKFGEKCTPKMCPNFIHNLSDKQKIIEIIKHHVIFSDDELFEEHRFVGKAANGKYFYLWGEKYLTDGLIPVINLGNTDSGIMYFNTKDDVIEAFNIVLEIIEFSQKELLGKICFNKHSISHKAVIINSSICYLDEETNEIKVIDNKLNYLNLFMKLKYDDLLP